MIDDLRDRIRNVVHREGSMRAAARALDAGLGTVHSIYHDLHAPRRSTRQALRYSLEAYENADCSISNGSGAS